MELKLLTLFAFFVATFGAKVSPRDSLLFRSSYVHRKGLYHPDIVPHATFDVQQKSELPLSYGAPKGIVELGFVPQQQYTDALNSYAQQHYEPQQYNHHVHGGHGLVQVKEQPQLYDHHVHGGHGLVQVKEQPQLYDHHVTHGGFEPQVKYDAVKGHDFGASIGDYHGHYY